MKRFSISALAFLAVFSVSASAAPQYDFFLLPVEVGSCREPVVHDMNNFGDVVGHCRGSRGFRMGAVFHWRAQDGLSVFEVGDLEVSKSQKNHEFTGPLISVNEERVIRWFEREPTQSVEDPDGNIWSTTQYTVYLYNLNTSETSSHKLEISDEMVLAGSQLQGVSPELYRASLQYRAMVDHENFLVYGDARAEGKDTHYIRVFNGEEQFFVMPTVLQPSRKRPFLIRDDVLLQPDGDVLFGSPNPGTKERRNSWGSQCFAPYRCRPLFRNTAYFSIRDNNSSGDFIAFTWGLFYGQIKVGQIFKKEARNRFVGRTLPVRGRVKKRSEWAYPEELSENGSVAGWALGNVIWIPKTPDAERTGYTLLDLKVPVRRYLRQLRQEVADLGQIRVRSGVTFEGINDCGDFIATVSLLPVYGDTLSIVGVRSGSSCMQLPEEN